MKSTSRSGPAAAADSAAAAESAGSAGSAPAPRSRAQARAERRRSHLARSRGAVIVSVLALGIGAGAAGTALAVVMKNPDSSAAGPVNVLAPQVNPRTITGEAFAVAAPGGCLGWNSSVEGQPADFYAVNCAEPHYFEVAQRIDLADALPGDSYPAGAAKLQLAKDRCAADVTSYVKDRPIDPEGRFVVALVPPSKEGWQAGDRSGLCGIAAKQLDGSAAQWTQPYALADQHMRWDPGVCLGVNDQRLPTAPVNCASDHSIEIVANVDVAQTFPDAPTPPSPAEQTELTAKACYDAAVGYVGDAERLRRSTLFPTLVQPISQGSWATGSRTVNCGLMRDADPGPFAVLRGSAKGDVLIEGSPPQVPTTTTVPAPTGASSTTRSPAITTQVPSTGGGGNLPAEGNAGAAGVGQDQVPVQPAAPAQAEQDPGAGLPVEGLEPAPAP